METDFSVTNLEINRSEKNQFKDNKEAHSKLLHQENQKTKKKRVSFSIFKADTIEEMQKLRKEKEEEFLTMLQLKNQSNKNLNYGNEKLDVPKTQDENSFSKILKTEPIKNEINFSLSQFENRLSKTNPVMINEIVKVENIFLQNQSDKSDNIKNSNFSKTQQYEVEHVFSSNIQNLTGSIRENHQFTSNLMPDPNVNTFNTNSFLVKSPKDNILFSNSNFNSSLVAHPADEKIREEDLMEEIKEHIRKLNQEINDGLENQENSKNPEISQNPEYHEADYHEQQEISHLIEEIREEDLILVSPKNERENINIVNDQILAEKKLAETNIEMNEEKEEINNYLPEQIINNEISIKENEVIIEIEENGNNKIYTNIEENKFTIENFCEIFLSKIEAKYIVISNNFKLETLENLKRNLKEEKILSYKISQFINKHILDKFLNITKTSARNKKYFTYNNQQADKYIKYRNYKIKSNIFQNLKFIADKRKDWISNIKTQLKMNYIWKCFDDWKLYVNYRIIKRYFKNKLKSKIFSAFKINTNYSEQLDKKVNILRYIFTSKKFIFNLRKNSLSNKNKTYNNQIAKEYNRSRLLRKIFKIILEFYRQICNSKRTMKEKLNKKIKNSEYIEFKILQNQVTKIDDSRGNIICKKIIKNNIKII